MTTSARRPAGGVRTRGEDRGRTVRIEAGGGMTTSARRPVLVVRMRPARLVRTGGEDRAACEDRG